MRAILKRILIVLITLTLVLIFVLPYCRVIEIKKDQAYWETLYLVQNNTTLVLYLPFIILWIAYLLRQSVLHFSIFQILLGATAFITFVLSFLGSIMIAQDYAPGLGENIALLLFPLSIVFIWIAGLDSKQTTASNTGSGRYKQPEP